MQLEKFKCLRVLHEKLLKGIVRAGVLFNSISFILN